MTTMEWVHVHAHRNEIFINILLNTYHTSIFSPTTFFYSLKWSKPKRLWLRECILHWRFNENIKAPWIQDKVRKRMWHQDSWQDSEWQINRLKYPQASQGPAAIELTFLNTSEWQQVNATKSVSTSQSSLTCYSRAKCQSLASAVRVETGISSTEVNRARFTPCGKNLNLDGCDVPTLWVRFWPQSLWCISGIISLKLNSCFKAPFYNLKMGPNQKKSHNTHPAGVFWQG